MHYVHSVTGDDANQPVVLRLNSGNHNVPVMEIELSGSKDTVDAKYMKCASFPNLALSTPMGTMKVS
jgi:hypothetical protein